MPNPPVKLKLKQSSTQKLRKCGHPFFPTYDMWSEDFLTITSYCAYCIVEKLGLKPCQIMQVSRKEDWNDLKKVRIIKNE